MSTKEALGEPGGLIPSWIMEGQSQSLSLAPPLPPWQQQLLQCPALVQLCVLGPVHKAMQ